MARAIPTMDDSSLNMTPMIDIVFQLILFFLFTLKFQPNAFRFEAMLPVDRGLLRTSIPVDEPPRLSVSLYRLDEADAAKARTKVKFAGNEWVLPPSATYEEREKTFAALRRRIHEVSEATGITEAEIKTPPPYGAAVPHGDVMKVLDTFVELELKNVKFGGAASPLPHVR